MELIGIDHVGVSTDFSFDTGDFLAELAANPGLFDDSYTRWGPIEWMTPATMMGLGEHLSRRGWSNTEVGAVMWQNFRRVAAASW